MPMYQEHELSGRSAPEGSAGTAAWSPPRRRAGLALEIGLLLSQEQPETCAQLDERLHGSVHTGQAGQRGDQPSCDEHRGHGLEPEGCGEALRPLGGYSSQALLMDVREGSQLPGCRLLAEEDHTGRNRGAFGQQPVRNQGPHAGSCEARSPHNNLASKSPVQPVPSPRLHGHIDFRLIKDLETGDPGKPTVVSLYTKTLR
ncbi:PREDICTED: uncharacterized protein LOC106148646 [Chinchilla lanigera]|uniref:uncharacterized protein LOC106148646 n=1 Tax=Chinchilla lanigera TaxID=34839 RepID=UPI00069836B2|nr:PREDICTED: uncharacterized protein LOC106148646 [Chinchilla lanigera]